MVFGQLPYVLKDNKVMIQMLTKNLCKYVNTVCEFVFPEKEVLVASWQKREETDWDAVFAFTLWCTAGCSRSCPVGYLCPHLTGRK